jgi:hypothetical protein
VSVVSPARELVRRLHHDGLFQYIGVVSDYLNADGKTTRIWKETRGNATRVDRVLVLANSTPRFLGAGGQHRSAVEQMANHARDFAGLSS